MGSGVGTLSPLVASAGSHAMCCFLFYKTLLCPSVLPTVLRHPQPPAVSLQQLGRVSLL